jgi:hypothetical protein
MKPKGLFAEIDIPEGSFVCFLTGCWSLQPLADATFEAKHPSLAYMATWDKVGVQNSTRSGDRSMLGLVVISRVQHSGANAAPTQLCRQLQGTVRDMGALMNSQHPHVVNCEAESVVLRKRHLKFDIPDISHNNLFYPAVFIKTTRYVQKDEELTWYYVVPGVPAFERSELARTNDSEASASNDVLKKWREGLPADVPPESLVPRSVCGPALRWSNDSWQLENDEIVFNTIEAFDPCGFACINPDARRKRKQETVSDTLGDSWSGAVSECNGEIQITFCRNRITFKHTNQTWGGKFVKFCEDSRHTHLGAPANASSSHVVHITYLNSNIETKIQTLHITDEGKARELMKLLRLTTSSGESTSRCEATLSLRSKARRLLAFLNYRHTHTR